MIKNLVEQLSSTVVPEIQFSVDPVHRRYETDCPSSCWSDILRHDLLISSREPLGYQTAFQIAFGPFFP